MQLQLSVISTSAFYQNSRLIADLDTKTAFICDPGEDKPVFDSLLKSSGCILKYIVLTHGHLDHVGGAASLAARFKVPIIGPAAEDRPLIEALDVQAQVFGLPRAPSFTPRFVTDGETIELLPNVSFKVLTTPGHTPGGVCWYQAEAGFVLCGDTLFAGSVGRTDFPGGSFAALEKSVKEKLYTLPDDTRVFCGHGPDTTIGEEKRSNPYVQP